MPNEYECELEVHGPEDAVARFRDDRMLWQVEPWCSCFPQPMVKGRPRSGRLLYTYGADVKTPGPPVSEMAAAYPELTLKEAVFEAMDPADEGECVKSVRYEKGREVLPKRALENPAAEERGGSPIRNRAHRVP